jgi:hypothetical protein
MEGLMLGDQMSVVMRDGVVWYFHHSMPVYSHAEKDLASFRLYTSQLCASGQCKLVDVHRVFGVTEISVKRAISGGGGRLIFYFAPTESKTASAYAGDQRQGTGDAG